MICRSCNLWNPITQEETLEDLVQSMRRGELLGRCGFANGYPTFELRECELIPELIAERNQRIAEVYSETRVLQEMR